MNVPSNMGRGFAALVVGLALGVLGAACDDGTGAAVGEACLTPGSTTECEADAVCDSDSKLGTVCLALCEKDEDCGSGEQCSGTSGSLKGCHPKE
jgi:hypothetical protein